MLDEHGSFWVDKESSELVLKDGNEEERFFIEEEILLDGNRYLILIPSEEEETDEALVLKLVKDNEDEVLSVIEDDAEFEKVKDAYLALDQDSDEE